MRGVNSSQPIRSLILVVAGVLLAASTYFMGPSASLGQAEGKKGDEVIHIKVSREDLEDGRRFRALREILADQDENKPAAVVLELNLARLPENAGEVYERLAESLMASEQRLITWVKPAAIGPGALIALGSEKVYFAPTGVVGGIGMGGETRGGSDNDEKASGSGDAVMLSVLRAQVRSLANLRGHDLEVAEAFVDPRRELKRGDRVLSSEGEVLTLSADQALEEFEGKVLFGTGLAASYADLAEAEGLPENATLISLDTGFERKGENQDKMAEASEGSSSAAVGDGEGEPKEAGDETQTQAPLFGRQSGEDYGGKILVLPVGMNDLVADARFEFMARVIEKAQEDGAAALIFDMDTPGGYAWQTQDLILNQLQGLDYPVITFVNTRAESAGAIIAIGTDSIYMKPAASIGSALVVTSVGGELPENMDQKVTQAMIAMVRNVAEIKGHNPDVAEAFVSKDKEVIIDGVEISQAGIVLNLNTTQATEVFDGKPVLAKGVANSIEEIVAMEGLEGEILRVEPLGMEKFAHWVQRLSFLLIVVGLAGAYMELNAPGFGVPGVVSLLAFGLFFFGNNLAGNLAGYELAVLLVLGLILIGIEIFILPGTMIPSLLGGVLVLSSVTLAMVDRYDFEAVWEGVPDAPSAVDVLLRPALQMAGSILIAILLVPFLLKVLPETPAMRWAILQSSVASGAALEAPMVAAEGEESQGEKGRDLKGLQGVALTDLRPAGKADFDGKLLDVTADGVFIDEGETIRVTKHEGSRIVVEPLA